MKKHFLTLIILALALPCFANSFYENDKKTEAAPPTEADVSTSRNLSMSEKMEKHNFRGSLTPYYNNITNKVDQETFDEFRANVRTDAQNKSKIQTPPPGVTTSKPGEDVVRSKKQTIIPTIDSGLPVDPAKKAQSVSISAKVPSGQSSAKKKPSSGSSYYSDLGDSGAIYGDQVDQSNQRQQPESQHYQEDLIKALQ